jgi:hypothetical protein
MGGFAIETTETGARVVVAPSRDDDDPGIVVGRLKDCALRAGEGDATVSRRHVAFRVSRDGKLCCRDLGSTHGTRAGAVEIGTTWTEVEVGGDGATATVTLGRGPTTVTCERRDEDDGSETDAEDGGSETEPEDDGARTMVTEDGEMTRRRRGGVNAETLGEAMTRTLETPAARRERRVDEKKGARESGRENFKRFVKQRVVGLNEGDGKKRGVTSPKKKRVAVATNRRDVVRVEMNEEAKEELKREAALDKEADNLWDTKVPAAGARKAPAKRRKR